MNHRNMVYGKLFYWLSCFIEKEATVAVLKNKTQGNYTLISQGIMMDRDLSLTERGMLLTLLPLHPTKGILPFGNPKQDIRLDPNTEHIDMILPGNVMPREVYS